MSINRPIATLYPLLLLLTFCAGPGWLGPALAGAGAENLAPESFEYRLGLGDRVEVQVWKEPELSKVQAVRIDGRISLPLIGDVETVGKSVPELKTELEKRFAAVVSEPAVSVLLAESKSWRYYILGQIRTPGEFAIDYPMTLLQALARSGGFLEWAKTDSILLLRREGERERIIHFDYPALLQGDKLAQNIVIAAGDTIIVP